MKKKILMGVGGLGLVALVLIAVFILRGKKEDAAAIPPPESYGEASELVTALPAGEEVTVTKQLPEEEEAEEDEDGAEGAEETEEEKVKIDVSYVYDGMEDPLTAIAEYCTMLTGEEYGFVPVDAEMKEIELPTIEGKKGSLMLVHPLDEEEHSQGETVEGLFSLRLNWSGKQCSVEVCQVPTSLVELIEPPRPEPLSVTEAVAYLYGFTPSKLGLTGNSMLEYQVLAMDGAVMVGGVPCLQMNVYGEDPDTGTNELAGRYFFSNVDRAVYSVVSEGLVEKLDL